MALKKKKGTDERKKAAKWYEGETGADFCPLVMKSKKREGAELSFPCIAQPVLASGVHAIYDPYTKHFVYEIDGVHGVVKLEHLDCVALKTNYIEGILWRDTSERLSIGGSKTSADMILKNLKSWSASAKADIQFLITDVPSSQATTSSLQTRLEWARLVDEACDSDMVSRLATRPVMDVGQLQRIQDEYEENELYSGIIVKDLKGVYQWGERSKDQWMNWW